MIEATITIGILTYKRPDYLETALRSACNQTSLPDEVLVVDDGSGPETRALVEEFQKHFPFIRYEWKENGGHSSARNYAVSQCRSTHLLWLDDDDALTPHAVAGHRALLERVPEADIVYGNLILCDEHLAPIEPMPINIVTPENARYQFFKHCAVPNPGTLTSMRCFERVGPYDEQFRHAEDYDFHARAASADVHFEHLDETLIYYRSHAENLATRKKQLRSDHERSLIVQRHLARETIEAIFYQQPWTENPQLALQQSCVEIALLFTRLGDYVSARDVLSQVPSEEHREINTFVISLLERFESNGLAGLAGIEDYSLSFAFMSEQFLDTMLDRDCTAIEMDSFRVNLARTRLANDSLKDIYPYLPWEHSPALAHATASAQEAARFSRLGAFEIAIHLLEQINSAEFQSLRSYMTDIIARFESGGIAALAPLRSHPLSITALGQHLIGVLEERSARYRKIAQEKAFSYDEQTSVVSSETLEGAAAPWSHSAERVLALSRPILRDAATAFRTGIQSQHQLGSLMLEKPTSIDVLRKAGKTGVEVSVIIPTFDRADLLLLAVQSVCEQGIAAEVIVVNDASAPIVSSTVSALKQLGIPLSITESGGGRGPSLARNLGAQIARGKWLVFLDDDDELMPGAIRQLVDTAQKEQVPFVYGDHVRRYFDSGATREEYRSISSDFRTALGIENTISCGTFVVSGELFRTLGGYQHDFLVHEDYNLHVRIAHRAALTHISQPIFFYNIRDSIGRQNTERRLYFYATSAMNHALAHARLATDGELKYEQRVNQYEQLARALREGAASEAAKALVFSWWDALLTNGLAQEIEYEVPIIEALCSELIPQLNHYQGPATGNITETDLDPEHI